MVNRIFLGILIGGAIGAVLGYFGKCSSGACPLTANPYRGAIYGAVVGALLASTLLPKTKGRAQSLNIFHIDSMADFKTHVLDDPGICLVDLFSDRCPPCKALAPTISSLANKYTGRITVCQIDIDKVSAVANRYKVRAIPTVLIIKDGKEVERLVGLKPESEYFALLDNLLKETKD